MKQFFAVTDVVMTLQVPSQTQKAYGAYQLVLDCADVGIYGLTWPYVGADIGENHRPATSLYSETLNTPFHYYIPWSGPFALVRYLASIWFLFSMNSSNCDLVFYYKSLRESATELSYLLLLDGAMSVLLIILNIHLNPYITETKSRSALVWIV